nr:uncharacterized protein LOC113789680 [Dermatophagoides pteronyssinus]
MGFNLTIVSHRYMFQSVFYEITLPEPMKIAYEECVRFFKRENGVCGKHMIIFLHPRYGSVDIDYHLNDRTYHLKVTTLQALILCQFESEDVEQLTLKKMAFATKIRVDDLLVTLKFLMENSFFSDNGQMIAIPPLLVKEPNVSVFTYDDTFAMNKQFRSQRLNINLAKAFWCDLSKIHYGDDHGLTIMKPEPMDVQENVNNNENSFTPSFFIRIINGDNVYNIPCRVNNDINVEIESSQMQMIKEEDEKMEVSSIPLITDENNGIDIDSLLISMIVVDDNVLQSVLNLLHQRRWLPFKIILDHLIKNFPLFTSENLRQQLETLIEIRAIIPHRLNDTVFSLTEILR